MTQPNDTGTADLVTPPVEPFASTAVSHSSSGEGRSFFGKLRDGVVGLYVLVAIGVILAWHDHGWLTAIGEGILWPFRVAVSLGWLK